MSSVVVCDPTHLRQLIHEAVATALERNRSKLEASAQRVTLHKAARLVRVRDEVIRAAADAGELVTVRRGRARWIAIHDLDAWATTTGRAPAGTTIAQHADSDLTGDADDDAAERHCSDADPRDATTAIGDAGMPPLRSPRAP